jgi:16S rRNA (cytosine1402-N4)-methyltransferase
MSEAGPRHIPVLLTEVLDALQPREGGLVVDGTFGAGGYSGALLDRGAEVVALDRDPAAIRAAAGLVAASDGRLRVLEARFGDLGAVAKDLGLGQLDGVVLDIGVSSMQLDQPQRGFSLRFDAPLDMRMSGTGRPPHRARYRRGSRDIAIRLDGGTRAHDRARRARTTGRIDPSGDAHVSGLAHRRQ